MTRIVECTAVSLAFSTGTMSAFSALHCHSDRVRKMAAFYSASRADVSLKRTGLSAEPVAPVFDARQTEA